MPKPVAIGAINWEKTFCPAAPSFNEKSASAKALVLFKESTLEKVRLIMACVVLSVESEYTSIFSIVVNSDENSLLI